MKSSVIVFFPPIICIFHRKLWRVSSVPVGNMYAVNSPTLSKTEVSVKKLKGQALWGLRFSVPQHGNSDFFRKDWWRSQEGRSFQPSRSWASRAQKEKFQLVRLPYYPLTS